MSTLTILGGFLLLFLLPLVALLTWFLFQTRPRRASGSGFKYVYVEDDGSARELTPQEKQYLSAKFPGGDGGRPYIKLKYESRTPDGRLRGYLTRRQLPKSILVRDCDA